jgi:hypothetical protein
MKVYIYVGVFMLEYTMYISPPPPWEEILTNVIRGKKYEKRERKRGTM